MKFRDIFFNSSGQLRSGWRFLIFLFASQIIFLFLYIATATFFAQTNAKLPFEFESSFIIRNFFLAFAALAAGWLCGKFFEGVPFRALGISFSGSWLKHLAFGSLYGTAAILLAALIAFAFGGVRFELNRLAAPSAIWLTLGLTLAVFIGGAFTEETFFRGYALQTFARARLFSFGILLTSVLFASGHLNNPNANAFSWINTFLAGIFFALGYYKTRTLWFSIGAHLMWNWVQGTILGIPVSGLKELTPAPIFQAVGNEIAWLTGGDYGIEAGFACTVALILTTLFVWFAPFLKPDKEMLAFSDGENPQIINSSES